MKFKENLFCIAILMLAWSLPARAETSLTNRGRNPEEKALLENLRSLRLRSDLPIGYFLSEKKFATLYSLNGMGSRWMFSIIDALTGSSISEVGLRTSNIASIPPSSRGKYKTSLEAEEDWDHQLIDLVTKEKVDLRALQPLNRTAAIEFQNCLLIPSLDGQSVKLQRRCGARVKEKTSGEIKKSSALPGDNPVARYGGYWISNQYKRALIVYFESSPAGEFEGTMEYEESPRYFGVDLKNGFE